MAISTFGANEIVTRGNVNNRITAINNMFPLSVANGGTGGTTPHDARTNLGVFTTYILYDISHTGDQPTNGNIDFRLPTGVTHLHDFKYLEFYFSNKADSGVYDDGIAVSKVYRTLSGTRFNNTINLSFAGASHSGSNTYFNLYNTRYNIETSTSSSTLSKAIKAESNSYYISFGETGCSRHAVDSNNDIYVWRVVGYKL